MILIAHRGNISGIIKGRENEPGYLHEALAAGYDIEVDVWFTEKGWFLGHDGPEHGVDESLFSELDPAKCWYHAKNGPALYEMRKRPKLHCFWIDNDAYTLTSKGVIWVHTKTDLMPPGSICVLPEVRQNNDNMLQCAGICSDFVAKYE